MPGRPSTACWGCGCHAFPHAPCSWGDPTGPLRAARSRPLPDWVKAAPLCSSCPGKGGLVLPTWPRWTPNLWGTLGLGQARTHLGRCHPRHCPCPMPPCPGCPMQHPLDRHSVLGDAAPGRCGLWVPRGAPLVPAPAWGEPLQPPACMGRAPGGPACTRDWRGPGQKDPGGWGAIPGAPSLGPPPAIQPRPSAQSPRGTNRELLAGPQGP